MDINEVQKDLSITLKDLYETESNKLLLWATIYQRLCNDLIESKVENLRQYLDEQIKAYGINQKKYKNKLDEIIFQYKEKMQKIVEQYNSEYIYIQNEIALSQSNQKIAVANLISSKRGEISANAINNEVLEKKSTKKILATAQKKLNYDVVIDECTDRLEKCMNDTLNTLNEIFVIKNNMISKNSDSILLRIRRFFSRTFGGEAKFNKYIISQLELNLKNIEKRTISKISDIKLEFVLLISQINKIHNDINLDFNNTLNQV